MAQLFEIDEKTDYRGHLAVLQKDLPFPVKRVFYIYDVPSGVRRGGHSHKKTRMLMIALSGHCTIDMVNKRQKASFLLNHPTKCLLLETEDFHWMKDFSKDATLLVLASEEYDPDDYIYQEPSHD